MNIERSESGGIQIVRISGEIDPSSYKKLQRDFEELVACDRPRIAADLSNVEHLNSTVLGILVSAMKSARRRGGELRLSGLKDEVMDVFRMTRLSGLFKIYATVADAVASFSEE